MTTPHTAVKKRKASSIAPRIGNRRSTRTQQKKAPPVELASSDESSDDDAQILSEYEMQRAANIKRNNAFLATLGLEGIHTEMGMGGGFGNRKSRKTAASRGLARGPKAQKVRQAPTRVSSRQRGEQATGAMVLHDSGGHISTTINSGGAGSGGDDASAEDVLPELDPHRELVTESERERRVLASIGAITISARDEPASKSKPAKSRYSSLKLMEADVVKVTRDRLYSVACYPSSSKLVVAAGDKTGMLGIVDLDTDAADDDDDDGVIASRPHAGAINTLVFDPEVPTDLLSTSYDGTVRCLDLVTGRSKVIYTLPDDACDEYLTFSTLLPSRGMLLSRSNGVVSFVDRRASSVAQWSATLTTKRQKINTVDVCPGAMHFFATAGNERVCRIWDARKIAPKSAKWSKIQLSALEDSNSINAAQWSPDGTNLLTCGFSNSLRIYNRPQDGPAADATGFTVPGGRNPTLCTLSQGGKSVAPDSKVKHDMQTGRFHSTFHAKWDPKHADAIICGSMERGRRRVQLFSVTGADGGKGGAPAAVCLAKCADLKHEELLASVQSRNIFHPKMNAIICGNASGRIHAFR